MKEEDREENIRSDDRLSIEATGWIAKRDQGFTAEEQDAFFEWLAQDPQNKEMFNQRLSLWEDMNLLVDWRPEHSSEPNPDLLAVSRRKPRRWRNVTFGLIAAVIIIGILGSIFHSMTPGKTEVLMLAFGGAADYESHVLEDGSVVELNQGAQVSVRYSKSERLIFLHTGEAYFTVAKHPNRPFLVRAADSLVRATGTAFNVSLMDDEVEVIVTEGRVMMEPVPLMANEPVDISEENHSQELVAGQRSVITKAADAKLNTAEINSLSFEEIDRRLSWKGEILDFTDVPLALVVAEFNQRNRTQIVITDRDLGDLKVTAKLRSSNLDQFVQLLQITMGIEAHRDKFSNILLTMGTNPYPNGLP